MLETAKTLMHVFLQAAPEEFLETTASLRGECFPPRLLVHDSGENVRGRLAGKCFFRCECLVETATERPHIRAPIDRLTASLLRAHVRGRPHGRPELGVFRQRRRLG